MTAPNPRADELIHEIGQLIISDEVYVTSGWVGISLVIEISPRRRMFGFAYYADNWEGQTPDNFDVIDKAIELGDVTAVNGTRFQRCLVQIKRPGPTIEFQFDFHGTADWVVTPGNLYEMVEKLRP